MEMIPGMLLLLLLLLLLCYYLYAEYLQICTWNTLFCSYSVVTAYETLKRISYSKILHHYHHHQHHIVAIKWEYISGNPSQLFYLSVCFVTYHSYKLNTISVTKLGRTKEVYLWQNSLDFSLQNLLEPFFIAQLHINI